MGLQISVIDAHFAHVGDTKLLWVQSRYLTKMVWSVYYLTICHIISAVVFKKEHLYIFNASGLYKLSKTTGVGPGFFLGRVRCSLKVRIPG